MEPIPKILFFQHASGISSLAEAMSQSRNPSVAVATFVNGEGKGRTGGADDLNVLMGWINELMTTVVLDVMNEILELWTKLSTIPEVQPQLVELAWQVTTHFSSCIIYHSLSSPSNLTRTSHV